jgi:HSP20 family molecular chaperone IbpA
MDVQEQGDSYLVHAELPGVKKEDIHVVVEGNLVSISAEVKQEKETKEVTVSCVRNAISARFHAPSSWSRIWTTPRHRPNSTMAYLN